MRKAAHVSRRYVQEHGREPTAEEVGRALDLSEEKIRSLWRLAGDSLSLDTPVGDEGDRQLGDVIEDKTVARPDDTALRDDLARRAREALGTLTPREEKILRMRFGIGERNEHSLEEVGQKFKVTRERIRQIEAAALDKLRRPSRVKKLRELLGSTAVNKETADR